MMESKMPKHFDHDLLNHLCAEIESAWENQRDDTVVNRLASVYPEYAEALDDFFDLLINVEDGAGAAQEEIVKSTQRTRAWLEREGYELAARSAREARVPFESGERATMPRAPINTLPHAVPPELNEPTTLGEMIERAVRLHNKPDALNFKRNGVWHSLSTNELIERTRNIALGLYSLGVWRGDRVAILSENCPEWTLSDAGCQLAGVVDITIYSKEKPTRICDILKETGARILFIQDRAAFERIAKAIDFATLEHVVFFAEQGSEEAAALTLAQLEERGCRLDRARPHLAEELTRAVHPHDPATIIYTSGTTRLPKAVILTHSNLIANLIACSARLAPSEEDVALSLLPLSHALERLAMYVYIYQGMSVYYESIDVDKPSASKKLCETLRVVQPTVVVGVPLIFEKLYAGIKDKVAAGGWAKAALFAWAVKVGKAYVWHALNRPKVPLALALRHKVASWLIFSKWRAEVGGCIRLFISGEEALHEDVEYVFASAGLPIIQGYGLTETSPVIAVGSLEEYRIGTVGRPLPNVDVRIADDGEIQTRGPCVMLGYFDPEATCKAFTPDGWFKTGDFGTLDKEGFLRFKNRKPEPEETSDVTDIETVSTLTQLQRLIKASPFVNQVAIGQVEPGRPSIGMVIVPNLEQAQALAGDEGTKARTLDELCGDQHIRDRIKSEVHLLTGSLTPYKGVECIVLTPEEFTRDSGELAPAYKIIWRGVREKYRDELTAAK